MNVPAARNGNGAEIMEAVLTKGDLAKLTPAESVQYYTSVCNSIGLNPLTRPLEYITLNGKRVLYARRDAADQLRKLHNISVEIVSQSLEGELFTVHVRAKDNQGRTDEDLGVVTLGKLQGEARANATLKAITKAKRRVTLSICGLGFLDETEVEDTPRRDNPHITRPEDIVDVPAADDPDRVPAPSEPIAELPRMQQRPIADKLGKELACFLSLESLEQWKNLPETAARLATLRPEWREVFQGKVKERLMELRSARKMQDVGNAYAALSGAKPADEGDPLDILADEYSKCTDAAAMWQVDQKLYIPFVQTASPDDRERANDIRQQHILRIEGAAQ